MWKQQKGVKFPPQHGRRPVTFRCTACGFDLTIGRLVEASKALVEAQPFGSERIIDSELASALYPHVPFCVIHFPNAALASSDRTRRDEIFSPSPRRRLREPSSGMSLVPKLYPCRHE